MIRYSSRDWLSVLWNFYRSGVIRRIYLDVLFLGAYAGVVSWLTAAGYLPVVPVGPNLIPFLTLLLSLQLAFHTNASYDRWWEGRKLWGAQVNASRNLAAFLHANPPPDEEETRRFFAARIGAFARGMSSWLREGDATVNMEDLEPELVEGLRAQEHPLQAVIADIATKLQKMRLGGQLGANEHLHVNRVLKEFLDNLGGCERIRNTPIPFAYVTFLKHVVSWFHLILPFALQKIYGYWSVPVSMFMAPALVGLEMIASDIQEPFGTDDSDLPTEQLSRMIRRQAYELLVGELPKGAVRPPVEPAAYQTVR